MDDDWELADELPKTRNLNRHFFKMFGIFLILVGLVFGGYKAWEKYFAGKKINLPQFLEAQKNDEQDYAALMRADTFGGKTPDVTLDLFIQALQNKDVELASKYFELEQDVNSPDYLTRRKWEDSLRQAKDEDRLPLLLDIALKLRPGNRDTGDPAAVDYIVLGLEGGADYALTMRFNKLSGVWKIENF